MDLNVTDGLDNFYKKKKNFTSFYSKTVEYFSNWLYHEIIDPNEKL